MADNSGSTINQASNFRAALYVAALVVLVLSVLASVSWISTRPGSNDPAITISGIFAYCAPVVAAILALLGGLAAEQKATAAAKSADTANIMAQETKTAIAEVSDKVNGQLTRLIDTAVQPAPPVPPAPPVEPAETVSIPLPIAKGS